MVNTKMTTNKHLNFKDGTKTTKVTADNQQKCTYIKT